MKCLICLTPKNITRHHVFPNDSFILTSERPTVRLCRKCHDELHNRLKLKNTYDLAEYIEVLAQLKFNVIKDKMIVRIKSF